MRSISESRVGLELAHGDQSGVEGSHAPGEVGAGAVIGEDIIIQQQQM